MGSATLWEKEDLGYVRKKATRTWGAETFPGATLPNAMVQLSPVTQYRSGAGYQYEDSVIYGFSHTNKGHWNLLHVPMMPVVGELVQVITVHILAIRKRLHVPGIIRFIWIDTM